MNYKARLTFLFVGLFFVVLSSILIFIYSAYADFRRDEFFERLREKSLNTARLLLEVKELDYSLLKIIDQNSINKMYDEKVLVFDEQNNLIYSSLDDERIRYSESLLDGIRELGDRFYVDEDGDEVVGIHYHESGKDYIILASAYDIYGIHKLENLQNIVLLALFFGTVLIGVASYFYIRQVFRPIDTLNLSIKAITENNLRELIDVKKDKDELDKLAINYNQMLTRLYQAFESQRAFVRNAAHELKTPMALIQGKLDRLSELAGDKEPEVLRLVNGLNSDIDQQAELVESLLLIQRLDSALPVSMVDVRVDEILDESVRELVSLPEEKVSIDITSSIETEDQLTLMANPLLLKICFRNLIRNALIYSADHMVRVSIYAESGSLNIRFTNLGESALSENLIFEPFFRQKQSGKSGHGLGLSIVRQIAALMKGTIQYSFLDGDHVFLLSFTRS